MWHKFDKLKLFVNKLPFFEYTTRVVIIINEPNKSGSRHCDHKFHDIVSEFVWIRTNKKKQFYVEKNNKKYHVKNYCIWFDDHRMHSITPINEKCFSIRVDGRFTDYFRKYIANQNNFHKKQYKEVFIKQ